MKLGLRVLAEAKPDKVEAVREFLIVSSGILSRSLERSCVAAQFSLNCRR